MLLKGKAKNKKSGILLSITSLPSNYGIGTLGKEAYSFIDFLKAANQCYWQILPICPVGKGNSPYCSEGSFAGEILLIDLDMLVQKGYLSSDDLSKVEFPRNINYNLVRELKLPILRKAVDNFNTENRSFLRFKELNRYWLKDFALFMTIKEKNQNAPFYLWEDGLKYRLPDSLSKFEAENKKEILFHEITQFFFFEQYFALKQYAEEKGIKIIGDIPFYVSLDSADVWSMPDCFRLGRDMTPVLVAGVPPDIFSSDGQLWGNPIYDWEYQKKTGYHWWKKRLSHCLGLYDIIRIDHFRAFADYYTIPYGAPNAKSGKWEKGVGIEFWHTVLPFLPNAKFIAEDLGEESPEVDKLVKETGFPNMKILQFAFCSNLKNNFLPKNYSKNCVCYTGTHDNDTVIGWYSKATAKERLLFDRITAYEEYSSPALKLISLGMKSKAETVIIPLQDYMELDSEHRLNIPGTPKGNWEWRYGKDGLTDELLEKIINLSKNRNR